MFAKAIAIFEAIVVLPSLGLALAIYMVFGVPSTVEKLSEVASDLAASASGLLGSSAADKEICVSLGSEG